MRRRDEKVLRKRLGEIIKDERVRLRKTQMEFAEILNISQSTLSKLENGVFEPSLSLWIDFCDLTHFRIEETVQRLFPNGEAPGVNSPEIGQSHPSPIPGVAR